MSISLLVNVDVGSQDGFRFGRNLMRGGKDRPILGDNGVMEHIVSRIREKWTWGILEMYVVLDAHLFEWLKIPDLVFIIADADTSLNIKLEQEI